MKFSRDVARHDEVEEAEHGSRVRPAQGSPTRSRTPSVPRAAAISKTIVTEPASGGEVRGRPCNGRGGRASYEGEEDASNGVSSGSGSDEGESTWITSV